MSLPEQFNIGSKIRARLALANTAVTQSSAAAPSSQSGVTVDRNETGLRRYYSCKAVVSGSFTGSSSAQTGSLVIGFQHSSDGTSWEAYSTASVPTAVVWGATSSGYAGGTTGGTEYDTIEQSVNLNGARRYVRCVVDAPTYATCSSGILLNIHGVLVFGGADELPAQ